MANLLHGSNGLKLTWRRGNTKSPKNGDDIDCLHLILKNKSGDIIATATLKAHQIAKFCIENNKC